MALPVHVRVDSQVDFSAGGETAGGMRARTTQETSMYLESAQVFGVRALAGRADGFSVRWVGMVQAATETEEYQFRFTSSASTGKVSLLFEPRARAHPDAGPRHGRLESAWSGIHVEVLAASRISGMPSHQRKQCCTETSFQQFRRSLPAQQCRFGPPLSLFPPASSPVSLISRQTVVPHQPLPSL
jgi:hypothetical protein